MADEVTSVNGSNSLKEYQNSQRVASTKLDQDAFLKLLVAQLANQDPLSPASDTEFIAQLAQFSSLEQMNNLTSTMTASQAYGLVGKYVYVTEINSKTGEEELVFGRVDGVINSDGVSYLAIGEGRYKLASVKSVVQVDDMAGVLGQSASLIGKYVKAESVDDDGNEDTTIGLVDKIVVKAGVVYANINGKEFAVGTITEIYGTEPPSGAGGTGSGETGFEEP